MFLLSCAVLFWAGNNVVAKGAVNLIPPFTFSFLRWFVASLIILPFAWKHIRNDWEKIIQGWRTIFLISLTGISAFNTFLYISAQTTSATNIALISTIIPATIALLSLLILKITLSRIQVVGLIISFLGVMLVILRGDLQTLMDLVFVEGDLWMLAGVLCGAFYPVMMHYKPDVHPLSMLAIIICLGCLLLIPLLLWDLAHHQFMRVNRYSLLSILFVATLPSLLSYLFWNRGIELVGANRAGLFLNLVPVFTAVMAYLLLGETLSWYHFAGLAMTISGMLLFNPEHLAAVFNWSRAKNGR